MVRAMSTASRMTFAVLLLQGCFSDPPPSTEAGSTTEPDDDGTTTASIPTDPDPSSETSAPGSTTAPPDEGTSSSTGAPQGSSTTGMTDETSSSTTDDETSSTGQAEVCGNAVIDPDEACDGDTFVDDSCATLGFTSGQLGCTDACTFDYADCVPPEGMVFVPPGEFEMGSLDHADEQPIRQVSMSGFFIDIHEVTAAEYQACIDEKACAVPMSTANHQYDAECTIGRKDRLAHPVNCIAYADAATYCEAQGKALPTEAQWEKAARGTDGRRYPWGDAPAPSTACTHAVGGFGPDLGCSTDASAPVGSVPEGVSPYGAHDMAGNTWEWVRDYYAATYDGSATLDPTGPVGGDERVLRGGGWYADNTAAFTTTRRYPEEGTFADAFVGFRCAQPLSE